VCARGRRETPLSRERLLREQADGGFGIADVEGEQHAETS